MRALAGLVALAAACGAGDDAPAGLPEREHTYTIDGGTFVELLVDLRAGTAMTVTWSADGSLQWQVHAHTLGGLDIYTDGVETAGEVTFTAPSSRRFGVQWSSFLDTPASLDVMLDLPADAVLIEW